MRLEYDRLDLDIAVRRRTRRIVTITARCGDVRSKGEVPVGRTRLSPAAIRTLATLLDGPKSAWLAAAAPDSDATLPRVVLHLDGTDLSAVDWEGAVRGALGDDAVWTAIVRASPVPPRQAGRPWTLPLRILFASDREGADLAWLARNVFGDLPADDVAAAVVASALDSAGLRAWQPDAASPSAELVHLDELPPVNEDELLSTAFPGLPGTLGWFTRFADVARTRLFVVRVRDERELRRARQLAGALAGRGGPAMFIAVFPDAEARDGFQILYDDLLHDRPLDWLARPFPSWVQVTLTVGGGREEALRVSSPALALHQLAESLQRPETARAIEAQLQNMLGRDSIFGAPSPDRVIALKQAIDRVRKEWPGFQFEEHETGGLIPSARTLRKARSVIPALPPPRPGRRTRGGRTGGILDTLPEARPGRFVNPSLWPAWEGADPIRQAGARLTPGEALYLGIRIGTADVETVTIDASAILEEAVTWDPDGDGAWVEIGVTGIDFDILGDPVQDVWMTRWRDSDLCRFAIVPQRAGVCVLRFCLYHRQNALQSFRLAALVGTTLDHAAGRAALAAALDVTEEAVGDAGWLTRLEFSRVSGRSAIRERRDRALSVVANDVNGRPVITVKGTDTFRVEFPGGVAPRVRAIRKQLDEIATPPIPRLPREQWDYAFGRVAGAGPNAGARDQLERALIDLARTGWALYAQLISRPNRERIAALLGDTDGVVEVAHVLIRKVIPWSLIYDRYFTDSEQTDADGQPVKPAACLAALPDADGTLPVTRCGEHADCLLHHRSPDMVACPLRFWGFRHAVEIPPHQSESGEAYEEAQTTQAARPAVLVGGLNESLPLVTPHETALKALPGELLPGSASWKILERRGQEMVRVLDDPALDLIYFYCHARGGEVDPTIEEPCIEFIGLDRVPRRVTAADLANGPAWDHRPLVILNGCGSVGFSPDALSPFLPILVRDRGAAGVLGAEISVWEPLAGEFALDFLRAFLGGANAGRALLEARRRLLAQMNPLGIVYTLYANADLTITSAAVGQPGG